MTEPTDAELDAVLCKHWPAFSMQATLVRMWVRAAMRAAIVKWGTPPSRASRPKAAPAWEHHARKLTRWLHCMSHNDSYFGEPAGLVKQVTGELNRLIGAAPQQEPATTPRFNCWSTNDGDSWFDHPADAQAIYDCLGNDAKVGDEYELTAGWKSVTARYRITEVVGDGEEYEVECISHPQGNTTPQPAPAPLSDDTERLNWLLWKLPGNALRYVVGELSDTSSGAEFRAAIDAARKQGDTP